jgi:GT2 family glycosyltransferase
MHYDPVTVSVTNYNGAKYLPWCLDAVKNLTPSPAEIIVVDNASTDHSVPLIKDRFPDVKLITLSQNEGPCSARNLALEEAAHPLVYQIDCDIAPNPMSLERLLEAMNRGGPQVVACQPRAVFESRHDLIHYEGGWIHYVGVMNLINFYMPLPSGPEGCREVDAVVSMALLMRKREVLEAGGYDSRYFILFEDHDLSYRLRMQGLKLCSVPEALVYHREGTEGVSFRGTSKYPRRRAYLQSRNRWIVLTKNHALRTLAISLPGLFLFELAWFAFSLREGFLLDFLRGKLSFFRMFPRLLAERRRIQAHRVVKDKDLLGARDLTFSPLIRKSGAAKFLEKSLNRSLRFWWRIVRALAG